MAGDVLSIEGAVATLTLSGSLDAEAVAALRVACEAARENDSVRVLVLRASGEVWGGWEAAALADAERLGLVGDPFRPLAELPQPTVAVLDGAVREAGLELALCADVRVGSEGATFAMASVIGGAMPIAGGLQRLARAVGRSHALEMVLTGATIDAERALQWGLLSAVAADAEGEARALAGRIAERGPIATRLAKEAVRRGLEMPLHQALRYETDLTVLLQTTADRAEGVAAFEEKRDPRFEGR